MNPLSLLTATALLALAPAAVAAAAEPAAPALRFQEIAPGIHAGLQPHEGRFDDANVLVVVGDEAVLVVDAPAGAEAVKALIEEVRTLTDRPLRYLASSHWHGDHTRGNAALRAAFGPQVEILGHDTLASDVPGRAAEALQRAWQDIHGELEAELAAD